MEWWIEEELQEMDRRIRPPRRRAMVGLVFPVIAGTAIGICVPISPMWFWGAGALLLLPLFVWVRRRGSILPLMVAVFCLMAAHARQSTGSRPLVSLSAMLDRPIEYVQFVAVALEDAVPRPARPGQTSDAVFHARVEGLNRAGTWRRVDDGIRVVLRAMPVDGRLPRYGERWHLHGIVRPAVPRHTGLFTLPKNEAVVDPDRAVFLDSGNGNPVMTWCMERRRRCRTILGQGLENYPEERGILQALLLGYREDLPAALRQDFASTGTVHIFAISGAHVGMITLLLAGLLRALKIPLTRWFLYLTPLLVAYTLTTGAAVSAIRACVMASLLLAAPFFNRRPDAISALAVAAIAILLVAPAQLGDLGFLLSFTAVAGLLAIQPVMEAGLQRVFHRDAWQLSGEEAPTAQRTRETALALTRYGTVSVSAWIGTSPLTAYFFNLFSPVALGMNLVVIPAAFTILLAGVMSLLLAPLGGLGSEVFNHAACVVASGLAFCIRWAAKVPGGHEFIRTPPAAGVMLWYVILAAASIMARRVRGAMAVGLVLLAVLAGIWGVSDANRCRVSVLDVGEGNAVLVQARSARMLVDTGPGFRAEDTLRMLRREGVNRLDALVLTHADAQHIGAASRLMHELPVRELWLPLRWWPSPLMNQVLAEAEATGVPVRRLCRGDSGNWPGSLFWEVLWPLDSTVLARADDGSLVMRVARFGVSILLMGDAGETQENALRKEGRSLAASVLLAGQHGDARATSAAWLEAVRPRDVILSAGPHADGRHPDEEVLARLAARGIRSWRTDQQGTIGIELAGSPARWPKPGYRIETSR